MWAYIILAVVWIIIISRWLVPVIRLRQVQEVYAVFAVGGLLSMVILGVGGVWNTYQIRILRIIGLILYIPSLFFVAAAFISLGRKGKPESGWEASTVIIKTGVFRLLRHPLYLGTAMWSLAVAFVFQSVQSTVVCALVIFCSFMASIKGDTFNIEKFGEKYSEYMKRVPMWNFFKNIFRRGI